MAKRITFFLSSVLVLGAVVTAMAYAFGNPTERVTQPIAFNHEVHITKAKLECTTVCHSAAATEVYAGLPSKWVCFECHDPDEETPDNPAKTRLAGYIDKDEEIPWKRVAVIRPDVFFSHRRHVTGGQIECARCHPGITEASQPLSGVALVMRMSSCLDCHRHEGRDVDCLACHR